MVNVLSLTLQLLPNVCFCFFFFLGGGVYRRVDSFAKFRENYILYWKKNTAKYIYYAKQLTLQVEESKFQTVQKVGKYFKCQRYFTGRFLTFVH